MSGVADLSKARARLRVTGADRVEFLHGQCTNDIKRLRPGQSCYAAFLNAKGKMRGEGHIFCRSDDFILEVNDGLQPSLERFIITEDVTIEDTSATFGEWLVLAGTDVPARPDTITCEHPLGRMIIGAAPLLATVTPARLEALRIEAGIPKWGADMDETTIPNEAGLERRAISYEKGCYIGQETIARIKTYGHVNRQLVQLRLPAEVERSTAVFSGDRDVGRITSVAGTTALGYVRRELAKPGTIVTVAGNQAEVIKLCDG
jgi:folate-binding protein YgfZ